MPAILILLLREHVGFGTRTEVGDATPMPLNAQSKEVTAGLGELKKMRQSLPT
jgi:hypothetical protein